MSGHFVEKPDRIYGGGAEYVVGFRASSRSIAGPLHECHLYGERGGRSDMEWDVRKKNWRG